MLKVTGSYGGDRYRRFRSVPITAYSAPGPVTPRLGTRLARAPARPAPWDRAERAANQTWIPAGRLRAYLAYLAVAFALAVLLSWSNSTAARLGYRINELSERITALTTEHEKLAFELSALESMARVEREATQRLGMVRPDYVRVSLSGAGAVASPSAAGAPAGPALASERTTAGVQVAARVIRLSPSGAGTAGTDGAGTAAVPLGRSVLGSLWDRLVEWLTGASQAEARDWD